MCQDSDQRKQKAKGERKRTITQDYQKVLDLSYLKLSVSRKQNTNSEEEKKHRTEHSFIVFLQLSAKQSLIVIVTRLFSGSYVALGLA